MERNYDLNASIVYVDPRGVSHAAIVTVWWHADHTGELPFEEYKLKYGEPGCNLVFVSDDESKKDPYGRQIERATSAVHKGRQAAPGNYWKWPDE